VTIYQSVLPFSKWDVLSLQDCTPLLALKSLL
jgi:hypothetical protein